MDGWAETVGSDDGTEEGMSVGTIDSDGMGVVEGSDEGMGDIDGVSEGGSLPGDGSWEGI